MAKIFSITHVELRPGVSGEEFEKFWLEVYVPLGRRIGWESHLLRGDRGVRNGQMAVIWEIPTIEARDRIILSDGQLTEEGKRLLEADFKIHNPKLDTLVTGWPYTDYVELGK